MKQWFVEGIREHTLAMSIVALPFFAFAMWKGISEDVPLSIWVMVAAPAFECLEFLHEAKQRARQKMEWHDHDMVRAMVSVLYMFVGVILAAFIWQKVIFAVFIVIFFIACHRFLIYGGPLLGEKNNDVSATSAPPEE